MTKHPRSDLDGDIRDHVARETEDNIARGMSPREARLAALRTFGSLTQAREEARLRAGSHLIPAATRPSGRLCASNH